MIKTWYYYLHTNGKVIGKNPFGVIEDELDESDFVVRWWKIDGYESLRTMIEDMRGLDIDKNEVLTAMCHVTEKFTSGG